MPSSTSLKALKKALQDKVTLQVGNIRKRKEANNSHLLSKKGIRKRKRKHQKLSLEARDRLELELKNKGNIALCVGCCYLTGLLTLILYFLYSLAVYRYQ